jgi:pimeloyl-ACP methyl ester carboxylesterase
MCLVAHSMGGVLSRLFLKTHGRDEGRFVHTFVTIASPLDGMPSAGMGASAAPVVVPSWRNLDPTGPTIPVLYDTPLPDGTEYHLFFAHADGESDTVVALSSQLRAEAMAEAVDMHGFSNTHTGVLRDERTSEHLNAALSRCGEMARPEPESAEPTAGGENEPTDSAPSAE